MIPNLQGAILKLHCFAWSFVDNASYRLIELVVVQHIF
jgi:hypothetical protein